MAKIARGTWLLIIAIVQSAIEAAKTIMTSKSEEERMIHGEPRLDFIAELLHRIRDR